MALARPAETPGAPVIVIAPPWQNAVALATKTGGALLAPGRFQFIAMVADDDPAFTQALYASGALAVVSSTLVSVLCKVE